MDKASEGIENPEDIFISLDSDISGKKRLSVERIYQRKTQLEHILLRPDTYVGSVEETTEPMYVYDEEKDAIIRRTVTFVPGLYKIFDEILVNAADNKQRDKTMNAMKININPEENIISVWNNGRGIPVEMHATENKYVPELIFGTLLTSSNYNDSQRKVTGGRNGYGAKLCNIFSSEFTVETASNESKKSFKMTWSGNMAKSGKTIIKDSRSDFTKVTFRPDLSKFGMTHLTKDMVDIMTRRVYDMAGCIKGVSVYFNGKKLPIKTFKDYVELYVKGVDPSDEEEEELSRKVVHEVVSPRWEVAVTASPGGGFQQASFVNSIATTKGGTHINYIVDQVVSKLLEAAKKKNKGGMDLKPFHIKNHVWVFVNCSIENPSFDSQTKENMTLKAKSFGSTCALSDKFIKSAMSCGVVERVLNWARAKSQAQIAKKQSGSKSSKLRGIAKLDDANEAGGKNSLECTLIVTEGDSAKSLAVSGLGVIGRDYYGVFPLRGKLLNVREATHNQIIGNEEIKNIIKIMGLQYNKKYIDSSELRTLRYGRLMIMADQDQDGSHIKGLVINFIHHNWPKLLRQNFVEEFITPIVKVTKSKNEVPFYSLPEFENWRSTTENPHTWKVKYYKGLGTSTAKEAKEYFSDMDRHRIPFKYAGPEDDEAIVLAFSKKCIEQRKEWLSTWLREKKQRREDGLNESFLYGEQTDHISYSMFINKELILFSNADNERSLPSMVDGLKPGQRKVLFTCFKRNDKKDIKVAQLAGSVAEHSAYHHGEASLMSTIINLAHNFVGSNNINLLQPIGQFGTRLHGGKDAASPRYIFTMLSPLTRLLFPNLDDPQLSYLYEDNVRIEPEWYCPILPMILVNGGEGIGTGYSTSVPNFNVRDIVANIKKMMDDLEPTEMTPSYKKFVGGISHVEPSKYSVYGIIARLSPTSLEITELPIRSWTQSYKENVLEPMLHGNEKMQPFITDYKEYHTDTTVRFVVNLSTAKMEEAEKVGFHKKFKMEGSINTSNMVLFDKDGCLKRYSSATSIMREFYDIRVMMYQKRMDYLVGMLSAESAKLTNQARFIVEKIEGKISIENKKKSVMIELLKRQGYKSDPVKTWKASIANMTEQEKDGNEEEEDNNSEKDDFYYLFNMSLLSLTLEKKEELLKNRDAKIEELRILKGKTPKDLWNEDIDKFMTELELVEEMERKEEAAGAKITVKKTSKSKGKSSGRQTKITGGADKNSLKHTKPSPFAETIEPQVPTYNANPKKSTSGRTKKEKLDSSSGKGHEIAPATSIKDIFHLSNEEDGEEVSDLATRLASKDRKRKTESKQNDPKQNKIQFKPKPLDVQDSESDSDLDNFPPPKVSRPTRTKAAAPVAYTEILDDSDSAVIENIDSDSDSIDEFNSDDDFISIPKKSKVVKPKATKADGIRRKTVTVAKTSSSKKPAPSSSVDQDISSEEENMPIQHARKRAKNILEDTLSEDELESPQEKAASPKKKTTNTVKPKPAAKKKTSAKPPPVKKAGNSKVVDKGQARLQLKIKPKLKKVALSVEHIAIDDGSGDSFDELLPPVSKKIKKATTKTVPDSDDSDFCPDDGTTARESTKSRPSRQKGKVKYNFNEDDDSDYNIND